MRLVVSMIALVNALWTVPALAHGDQPHPTCKKGYVLTGEHKCVKAPK